MENNQGLISWALSNANKLSLKVTRLTGSVEWLPGYFDYHVAISLGDVEVFGRGTDEEESCAFLKAVSEAVERVACQGLEYPWATATHSDVKQASIRAYRELLGMDRALCHHFAGVKIRPLDFSVLKNERLNGSLQKSCEKHGVALHIFEMRPSIDSFVVSAYAWMLRSGASPGVLSGYGCATTLTDAARQAVIECVRKVGPIFIENSKPKEELSELEKIRSPWWHIWKMSQESAGLRYLKSVLIPTAGESVLLARENLSMKDVGFREIGGFRERFPDVPCVVMQAYSEKLILPQFGRAAVDDRTLSRLKAFGGESLTIELDTPHLYG